MSVVCKAVIVRGERVGKLVLRDGNRLVVRYDDGTREGVAWADVQRLSSKARRLIAMRQRDAELSA